MDDHTADEKDDLNFDIYILTSFCVALGLTSLGCMGTGMFTLIYAAPTVGYPYGIASGVWTGLFTFAIFMHGICTLKLRGATPTKIYAFYICIIIDIIFSIVHVSLSAVGLRLCIVEFLRGEKYCNRDDRGRIMLMEGFNLAFGITICILAVAVLLFMSTKNRLRAFAGHRPRHLRASLGNRKRVYSA